MNRAAGGGDQHESDQEDESDAAAAALRAHALDRRAGSLLGRLLLRHDQRGISIIIRPALSAPAHESTQGDFTQRVSARAPAWART